jgi:hypothetical protein
MSDTSSGRGRSGAKRPTKKKGRRKDALASEGVLANLPRTRPQRGSARRDAARLTAAGKTTKPVRTEPVRVAAVKPATAKKRPAKATKRAAKPLQDPAPRQGFETESDPVSGPVSPPGGVDLFASAAELAGELTKNGLSTGGRLLKDVLGRLPLN